MHFFTDYNVFYTGRKTQIVEVDVLGRNAKFKTFALFFPPVLYYSKVVSSYFKNLFLAPQH